MRANRASLTGAGIGLLVLSVVGCATRVVTERTRDELVPIRYERAVQVDQKIVVTCWHDVEPNATRTSRPTRVMGSVPVTALHWIPLERLPDFTGGEWPVSSLHDHGSASGLDSSPEAEIPIFEVAWDRLRSGQNRTEYFSQAAADHPLSLHVVRRHQDITFVVLVKGAGKPSIARLEPVYRTRVSASGLVVRAVLYPFAAVFDAVFLTGFAAAVAAGAAGR